MEISKCSYEDGYVVCFCNKFCIKGIESQKKVFSLPFSKYNDKKYKNIFIEKKDVYLEILDCVNGKKIFQSSVCEVKPSLVDFIILKSTARVANAVVNFDGINVVFGIVKKNNYFLVFPPHEFIFIDDDYKKSVFKYIIDLWKEKR